MFMSIFQISSNFFGKTYCFWLVINLVDIYFVVPQVVAGTVSLTHHAHII